MKIVNKTSVATVLLTLGTLFAINNVDALKPVKKYVGLGTGIL